MIYLMSAVGKFGDAETNAPEQQLHAADMSVNNSSIPNPSLLLHWCSDIRVSFDITTATNATRTVLTLPLCTLVLHVGLQRWRQQRSFKSVSHSDIFTYHLAAMHVISALGLVFYFCGIHADFRGMVSAGICATAAVYCGDILFHLLTCVERYLAVVHPIAYLRLKDGRGVSIRNISIGCVWLLCLGWGGVTFLHLPDFPTVIFLSILVFSLVVVSVCSLSVLYVLMRPGPGDGGGEKERVDQSKRRAFHIIAAITGALWSWFVGLIVVLALQTSLSHSVGCMVIACANWCNLPSTLLLPLMFLHRAGKLPCCC